MENIDYEAIRNTPIAIEVAKYKEEIENLQRQIKRIEDNVYNLYKTCKHTYKIDYTCSSGYDYYKICTKCGHVKIE